ncbi:MAG: hypothetical protein AAF442_08160 [Pseudomonadota bacterium]
MKHFSPFVLCLAVILTLTSCKTRDPADMMLQASTRAFELTQAQQSAMALMIDSGLENYQSQQVTNKEIYALVQEGFESGTLDQDQLMDLMKERQTAQLALLENEMPRLVAMLASLSPDQREKGTALMEKARERSRVVRFMLGDFDKTRS